MEQAIKQLINDMGQTVIFRRQVTSGGYDPSTGTTGAATNNDETVKVVFVDYDVRLIDGENIRRGDRKALMSAYQSDGTALSKAPQSSDQLIGEGDTVNVVEVKTLKPSGVLVGYELQVRE